MALFGKTSIQTLLWSYVFSWNRRKILLLIVTLLFHYHLSLLLKLPEALYTETSIQTLLQLHVFFRKRRNILLSINLHMGLVSKWRLFLGMVLCVQEVVTQFI